MPAGSIERLHHVQLAMPPGREDDARKFYGGILGIPELAKPPHLAVRGGVWFERPSAIASSSWRPRPEGLGHFGAGGTGGAPSG